MIKKIFWCLQQLEYVGGTETVSIQLANNLVEKYDYDITFIVAFKSNLENCPYKINPKIKIIQLGIDIELARFSDNFNDYFSSFRFIKSSKLLNKLMSQFFFQIKKKRQYISSLLDDESLLICSSIESYCFAPKDKNVLFHFHFNSTSYFDSFTRFTLKHSNKPTKYIFLCKETMEKVISKDKAIKDKATFINNPCRFDLEKSFEYHNNTILFIGRYSTQKNPLLALKVAKVLKEKYDLDFKMNFYGEGGLIDEMQDYVSKNKLENQVSINSPSNDVETLLKNADLLLMTSIYEGLPLIKLEAESKSLPTISTNWGEPIEDIINDGINGYIVNSNKPTEIASKIYEVLSNKEELTKLKQSTYQNGNKYHLDTILDNWDKLFKSL